jgi:hypothetical protein
MVLMFSTLATLVLLSFLLLLGVVLLVWSLVGFGTGPRAVSMSWGRGIKPEEIASHNPFIKKPDVGLSELVPDHISRGQIRTIKKPVSDASLAEIKAITQEKVEKSVKTTTYEQMVKRSKPSAAKARDPKATQTQISNDQLRGAHAVKRTLVDAPVDVNKPDDSSIEILKEVPPFIQVNDLKAFPPLPPVPAKPGITHSSKDTPVTKLPTTPSKSGLPKATPEGLSEPLPEKKLWPAPLTPMVPKPVLNTDVKPIAPQPIHSSAEAKDVMLKPEAVEKSQSRKLNDDPFDKFSKDKKDDTLF